MADLVEHYQINLMDQTTMYCHIADDTNRNTGKQCPKESIVSRVKFLIDDVKTEKILRIVDTSNHAGQLHEIFKYIFIGFGSFYGLLLGLIVIFHSIHT